jgi:hypothetical protein
MRLLKLCLFAFCLAVVPGAAFGQANADAPIKTTVCELAKEPSSYKGKIVTVRGRVLIDFEDFELSTDSCDGRNIGRLWLEYGNGPKRQPTTWCCGDMTPRDPLRLIQNSDFRKFHRLLTAQRSEAGCYESDCYLYEVTASITGRVDSISTKPCRDGNRRCCAEPGFGHLGVFCSRLVIQSLSDVVAKAIAVSDHKNRN